ncbi:MAG TPA: hypothetical protein VGW35_04425 [Methylomirabilota bacterium]|jgi:hypothetical protein|nr:hypothetical protein [Methylomirabilota bacterium]
MSLDRLHISCELSRRQLLAGHVATWMGYWPGVLVMVAITAFVFAMAWWASPWFLLSLVVLFPAWNNVVLCVAGFVRPLLFGPMHVDVVVEEDRIGQRVGQAWHWLPLEKVDRVARFGGVWAILSLSNISIYIPASAIDEKYIAHVRAVMGKSRQG